MGDINTNPRCAVFTEAIPFRNHFQTKKYLNLGWEYRMYDTLNSYIAVYSYDAAYACVSRTTPDIADQCTFELWGTRVKYSYNAVQQPPICAKISILYWSARGRL